MKLKKNQFLFLEPFRFPSLRFARILFAKRNMKNRKSIVAIKKKNSKFKKRNLCEIELLLTRNVPKVKLDRRNDRSR